jgi:hypothetical protein
MVINNLGVNWKTKKNKFIELGPGKGEVGKEFMRLLENLKNLNKAIKFYLFEKKF